MLNERQEGGADARGARMHGDAAAASRVRHVTSPREAYVYELEAARTRARARRRQ